MSAREIEFGDVTVFILPSKAAEAAQPNVTVETAAKRLPSIAEVIREMANGLGAELRKVGQELAPSGVEVELKLGLSEGADIWFINVEGEQAITVKMTWKLGPQE